MFCPTVLAKAEEIFNERGEDAAAEFLSSYKEAKDELNFNGVTDARQIADVLYKETSGTEGSITQIRKHVEAAKASGFTPEVEEAVLNKYGKGEQQSPEHEALIDKFFEPMRNRINELYTKIKDLSPEMAEKFDKQYGLSRLAMHTGKWSDFFAGAAGGDFGGFGVFGKTPSALKGRTIFQLEDGTIIQRIGDDVFGMNEGQATHLGQSRTKLKAGDDFNGKKIQEVRDQRDIEKHIPNIKYTTPMFAHAVKWGELERFSNQMEALDKLKSSEIGQHMMRSPGEEVPEHFINLTEQDKIPQLRGYKFDPKLAEVLDDYLQVKEKGSLANIAENLNGLIIKSFMLNPLPHIGNELAHYFAGRGLVQGWINPRGLKYIGEITKDFRSVINQDEFQIALAKNGASLTSMAMRNRNWMNDAFDVQLKQSQGMLTDFATKLGLNPLKFIDNVSKLSNTVMWTTRDALYTNMIREQMERFGQSMPDAIKSVDRFMPTYRIPSRVLGQRWLSQVMQNRGVTVFSRYHYGMMKAFGETAKDFTTKGKRMEGLDHVAAYAAGMLLFYPLVDAGYQAVFGPNVKSRRQGGYHMIDTLIKTASGEKMPETDVMSVVNPAPTVTAGLGMLFNRELYSGKQIHNPEDTKLGQLSDELKYAAGQLAPMAGFTDVATGKRGATEVGFKQADIEYNDPKKAANREKARKRLRSEAKKRQKERGY